MDENGKDTGEAEATPTQKTRRNRGPNRSKAELIAEARMKLAKLEGRAAQADYSNDPRVVALDQQIGSATSLTLKYQRWTEVNEDRDANPKQLPAWQLAIANFRARISEWEQKGAEATANSAKARNALASLKEQRSNLLREIAGTTAQAEQGQTAQA